MAITSETIRNDYVGNGILTTYPFEFIIYDQDEIAVYVDGVIQTVDIHFTIAVEDIENPAGGNIVFGILYIPADLSKIAIMSDKPYTQETVLALRDETYEETYDKAVVLIKQLREMIDRCVQLGSSSPYSGLTLPEPQAEYYLRWKEDLSGLENISHPSDRFSLPRISVVLDVNGEITVTGGPAHYVVSTYGGAASDNLVKVNGLGEGDVFRISAAVTGQTVVVKNGTYFDTAGGMDCTLDNSKYRMFFTMGVGNVAEEDSRSANA